MSSLYRHHPSLPTVIAMRRRRQRLSEEALLSEFRADLKD